MIMSPDQIRTLLTFLANPLVNEPHRYWTHIGIVRDEIAEENTDLHRTLNDIEEEFEQYDYLIKWGMGRKAVQCVIKALCDKDTPFRHRPFCLLAARALAAEMAAQDIENEENGS